MRKEHWLTPFAEIEERLAWYYTRTRYKNKCFTVWCRDKKDRPIYLRDDGVPLNWVHFVLVTPRDIELAKILHLDWSLEEENAFDDLLRLLENGGFPNGSKQADYNKNTTRVQNLSRVRR